MTKAMTEVKLYLQYLTLPKMPRNCGTEEHIAIKPKEPYRI